MGPVTLLPWTAAALAGVYLLSRWLTGGGLRRQAAKVTRFPTLLVFGHPAAATVALLCWALFLTTGEGALAWAAFCVLALAALLGFMLFTRWLGGGRHAKGAERRFPLTAVVLHGLAGLVTFVMVLLTAARL